MKCEYCNNDHDGKYGAGRFCNSSCARGFSTKSKRVEINKKVSETLKSLSNTHEAWNKGKTIVPRINLICKCGKVFTVTETSNRKYCSQECAHQFTNWSEIHKKSYAIGTNFVAGGITKWLQYKGIKVQGNFELRTCSILDSLKDNNKISSWSYASKRIKYFWNDGSEHTYIIDFEIINNDNSIWYLEVKGYVRENDEIKWATARNNGLDLQVWFKKDIENKEKELFISV